MRKLKKHIFSVLDDDFFIPAEKSVFQLNHKIYHTPKSAYVPMYANKLDVINSLINVFGLTEKQCKWYVKAWFRKQNKGFDFSSFWRIGRARFIGSELTLFLTDYSLHIRSGKMTFPPMIDGKIEIDVWNRLTTEEIKYYQTQIGYNPTSKLNYLHEIEIEKLKKMFI
jgi:hypothetical protein